MAATKIAASTAVSAARNGRRAGLGSACPITLEDSLVASPLVGEAQAAFGRRSLKERRREAPAMAQRRREGGITRKVSLRGYPPPQPSPTRGEGARQTSTRME